MGCVVLGCTSTPALAIQTRAEQKPEVVGVIGSCKGSITGFKLSRAGQKGQPVKVLMPLWEGDQITAQGSSVLTIAYTDRTTEEIEKKKSPFTVKAQGDPVNLGDNVWRLLSWTYRLQEPLGAAGTRGKDERLGWMVPGVSAGSAHVVRSERRLGVAWKGGKGPYRVMIRASDGKTLLDERAKDRELLSVKPLKLSSGRYKVLIIDAKRKQLKGSFTVVEPSVLPVTEAAPAWFPKGAARAFRAQELASEEEYRWCYEAYLSLIGVEEDFGEEGKGSWPARLRQEICY